MNKKIRSRHAHRHIMLEKYLYDIKQFFLRTKYVYTLGTRIFQNRSKFPNIPIVELLF